MGRAGLALGLCPEVCGLGLCSGTGHSAQHWGVPRAQPSSSGNCTRTGNQRCVRCCRQRAFRMDLLIILCLYVCKPEQAPTVFEAIRARCQ